MTGEKKLLKYVMELCLSIAIVILIAGIVVGVAARRKKADPSHLVSPDWIVKDYLVKNPYSRPGERLERVKDIVVHYVGNPGTSAKQNRDYFNSLAEQKDDKSATSASSHFIISKDGTIIQCIPLTEIAYANYPRNYDTISIECCHPDENGEFTEATKKSLIRLTSWLCRELGLSENHVIRHYDVSGKECPIYYVRHEDEWKQLKKEIQRYMK